MTLSLILVWTLRLAGLIAVTSAAASATWFATVRDRTGGDAEVSNPAAAASTSRMSVDWPRPFIVRIDNPERVTSDEQQLEAYRDAVAAGCVRALEVLRPGDPAWLDDGALNEINANRYSFGVPPILVIELPNEAALGDPRVMEASPGCR